MREVDESLIVGVFFPHRFLHLLRSHACTYEKGGGSSETREEEDGRDETRRVCMHMLYTQEEEDAKKRRKLLIGVKQSTYPLVKGDSN